MTARVSEVVGPTRFGELVGRAPAMRALFSECARLATREIPVLVCGEAGTGKDVLARTLHAQSPRRAGPFVVLDCSASPEALASELFGRADGATRGRPGALGLARGGTLVLDEVADLPMELQLRLHAALEAGHFARDGGTASEPLEVHLITASKRRLPAEVARGRFAPALYQRLAGASLLLPPLRDRREDIPLLSQTLLARLPEGSSIELSADALNLLAQHDWPGNVRELRNVIERFAYAVQSGHQGARRLGSVLLSGELASAPVARVAAANASDFEPGFSYRDERARFEADFERRYVGWLLERHDGNVSAAARAADMDRKYLYKLAKKHGLKSSE